jgi:hypothetical protein
MRPSVANGVVGIECRFVGTRGETQNYLLQITNPGNVGLYLIFFIRARHERCIMKPLGRHHRPIIQTRISRHHLVAPICRNILLDFWLVSVPPFVEPLGAAISQRDIHQINLSFNLRPAPAESRASGGVRSKQARPLKDCRSVSSAPPCLRAKEHFFRVTGPSVDSIHSTQGRDTLPRRLGPVLLSSWPCRWLLQPCDPLLDPRVSRQPCRPMTAPRATWAAIGTSGRRARIGSETTHGWPDRVELKYGTHQLNPS